MMAQNKGGDGEGRISPLRGWQIGVWRNRLAGWRGGPTALNRTSTELGHWQNDVKTSK